MAVNAGADFITSVANLASGVVGFVTNFFPEKEDPMLKMIDFASHEITQKQVDQIILNSAALVGFSTVMATVKTINIAENLADLASGIVNFASSFFPEGKDPMIEMKKFAGHEFTQKEVDQIMLNSKALIAFSSAMAIDKTVTAAGDISSSLGDTAKSAASDASSSVSETAKAAASSVSSTVSKTAKAAASSVASSVAETAKEAAKEVASSVAETAKEAVKESVKEAISQSDVDKAWNDYVGLQSQGKYQEAEQARQKMLQLRHEKNVQDRN
jgi:hypothetical protein